MLSEKTFETLYLPARTARLERRYRVAIGLCTEILERYGLTARQQSVLLEMRGICYTGIKAKDRAESDLQRALKLAVDAGLVHDQAHVLTSVVRLRLVQGRHHAAAETILPRARQVLLGINDHESMVLRASIHGLYGVIRFRDGRLVKAFEEFQKAETILRQYPDDVRMLRNVRRMAYLLCWYGRRSDARFYAARIRQLAQRITENGDPRSLRLSTYITLCTWVPFPSKWLLRPVRRASGL
jgi:hypothetical protein